MRRKKLLKLNGTWWMGCAFLVFLGSVGFWPRFSVKAVVCPDVRIVFARGSGEERWTNKNYVEFKKMIEERMKSIDVSYEFIDLDYPAVGIGIEKLGVTLGAFFGAGEAYEFGESVSAGVNNLVKLVNAGECPGTKYVLGGYSQGAMVTSKALHKLKSERVIYAATFGDPKIYLPEGAGMMPAACKGKNLSEYRMYVPDCRAYKGLLGANIPYQPEGLAGKVGTWCNKFDVLCSSWFNIKNHISYIDDGIYADAAKVIFAKICQAFSLNNRVASEHDTVIMLDSTESMKMMLGWYKDEALRLAQETLDSGGRVALYDYRDLAKGYEPVEHCNFETCTLEVFQSAIESIGLGSGGDEPESLLSASFYAMKSLKWKFGATKSMVVLTDAPFLLPDRDGVTLDEVVRLSKEIDPVNFYVVTEPAVADYYTELTSRTDGMVVTDFGKLTDYIMDRYDSLPRVEEEFTDLELPSLVVSSFGQDEDFVEIQFSSSSGRALVILNEAILGIVEGSSVVIDGVDLSVLNQISLVPISDEMRGEAVLVEVGGSSRMGFLGGGFSDEFKQATTFIPKVPNSGRR